MSGTGPWACVKAQLSANYVLHGALWDDTMRFISASHHQLWPRYSQTLAIKKKKTTQKQSNKKHPYTVRGNFKSTNISIEDYPPLVRKSPTGGKITHQWWSKWQISDWKQLKESEGQDQSNDNNILLLLAQYLSFWSCCLQLEGHCRTGVGSKKMHNDE